jgi:hypothetical protein
MTDLTTRLEQIRSLRAHTNVMYQSVAAPVQLPGKKTAAMAIKMAYEQVGREQFAERFKRVLDDLDQQERAILIKMALE